jgi:hypothetical protein
MSSKRVPANGGGNDSNALHMSFDSRPGPAESHSTVAVQLSAMVYKHVLIFTRNKKNLVREIMVPILYMALLLILKALVTVTVPTQPQVSLVQPYYGKFALDNWINYAGQFANTSSLVIGHAGCGGASSPSAAATCSEDVFDLFFRFFSTYLQDSLEANNLTRDGTFCTPEQLNQTGHKSCLPPLVTRRFDDRATMLQTAAVDGNFVYASSFSVLPQNVSDVSSVGNNVVYTMMSNHTVVDNISTWLSNTSSSTEVGPLPAVSDGLASQQAASERVGEGWVAGAERKDGEGEAPSQHGLKRGTSRRCLYFSQCVCVCRLISTVWIYPLVFFV